MARQSDPTGLRLQLEGQVTLKRLGEALDTWTDLLQEVGRDVAGATSRDAVRFVISDAKGGSFSLGVRPQPGKKSVPVSVMPRIARTLTAGIRSLERRATRPKHFSDKALINLRDLARLTSPETPSVTVSNGKGTGIALSTRLVAHVESVLAPELESIGTVEGSLEGLITHRQEPIPDLRSNHQPTGHVLFRWSNRVARCDPGIWEARCCKRADSVATVWRKSQHHRESPPGVPVGR